MTSSVVVQRVVGFGSSCLRVAALGVVKTTALAAATSPQWARRLTMTNSVTEILVRQADERAKAEAKANDMRSRAARGTKKEKAVATQKAQRLVDDLRYKHEDELEELGLDPDGDEVESLLSTLMARVDVTEEAAIKSKDTEAVPDGAGEDVAAPVVAAAPTTKKAAAVKSAGKEQKQKKSKAQKKKEAAEAARKQRRAEAEAEAAEMAGKTPKELEDKAMEAIMHEAGLQIHPIMADGNCLYRSVQHQLAALDIPSRPMEYTDVRYKCAETLRAHRDDYQPFVDSEKAGVSVAYEKYCDSVEKSSEWGGELEVQALSRAYNVEILLFQSSTAPITFGKGNANGQLRLSYHQHYYHLGAHYNSVVALSS